MKHLKSCAAAVLAIIAADAAFAQTTIRLTGSTAFRSATLTSIKNIVTVTDSALSVNLQNPVSYR
jgi:hypothetical protein